MSGHRLFCTLFFCTSLAFAPAWPLTAAPPDSAQRKTSSGSQSGLPGDVPAALEAELAGNSADRTAILRQRLAEAPEDPAAHWHLGDVRVGEDWVPYSQAADQPGRREQIDWFRTERARQSGSSADLRSFARQARQRKMPDEERAVLARLVSLEPTDRDAHVRLGDVPSDGGWIPRESAVSRVAASQRWSESSDKHGERAVRLTQRLRRLSAKELASQADPFQGWKHPDRVFALEQAMDDRGDAVHSAFVKWLDRFDCYEATIALARQAIFSEHATIRTDATSFLKPRPREDYLHALVGSARLFRADPTFTSTPSGGYAYSMEWTGIDGLSRVHFVMNRPMTAIVRRGQLYGLRYHRLSQAEMAGELANFEFWKTLAEVEAESDAPRTARIVRTVSAIAGRPLETPAEVAAWWRDVEDQLPVKNQVSANYESTWYVDRRGVSRNNRPNITREVRMHSCLVAGTPIVTELGPRAVETIEPGDRVLAQDVETGELVFKPVLGRTLREKAVLYRLRTAGDEVVCSQGHPFWINGLGWVQARSLQAGMPLHTVRGSTEVRSVEPAGEGAVHNLIVADTHSYFVGSESPFLSHDVTPRAPTNSLVPGLSPLWESEDDAPAKVSSAR